MNKISFLFVFLLLAIVRLSAANEDSVQPYPYAVFTPVDHTEVELSGGFLGDIRKKSRDIGIPTFYDDFEDHDYMENFRICAEKRRESHIRRMNCNEFIYKHMAAMSWYSKESVVSEVLLKEAINTILPAQQPDGYLNTYYENILLKEQGERRFAPSNRCEFLNFGHFAQAGIANYRANGDTVLLNAAVRFADLIVDNFAFPNHLPYTPYQGPVNKKYEHPNHELAMVDLYRVTGDKRYLDFAMQTITEYGYFGDEHFNEIWGHAVMENLLEAGAVDVYLENGDKRIMEVATRLWNDVVEKKMYITGGTGCVHGSESYGKAYDLPNETAYSETCAAIALFFWHHNMLLATGDAKYADEMDRALYNNILAGYGQDGRTYFYMNPLAWNPEKPKRKGTRFEWHHCPCCPPYIHRLLSSIDQYIYTRDAKGVQINLYADSKLEHTLEDGDILVIKQETEYPHKGVVSLTLDAPTSAKGVLRLRVPQWCKKPTVSIDGKAQAVSVKNGYIALDQPWRVGKKLVLNLPMKAVVVKGNSQVADQERRIAVQRGPLVYCIEQADNEGVDLTAVRIDNRPTITEKYEPNLLGGLVRLSMTNKDANASALHMIPYYAWANRESGRMMVWLPTDEMDVK